MRYNEVVTVWRILLPAVLAGVIAAGCRSPSSTARSTPVDAGSMTTPVKGGKIRRFGTFQVSSANLLISDPSYDFTPDGSADGIQAEVKAVPTGTWRAEALTFKPSPNDERCAELRVFHSLHAHKGACEWRPQPGMIGVDSGQAGIFDREHFQDDSVIPPSHKWRDPPMDPTDRWYSLCCEVTLSDTAGVIPFGAVASSGYGDGGYSHYVCRNGNGAVQGIRLVFISQEDEEVR